MGVSLLMLLSTLGQSPEWKGLLQYQKNFLGAESSEVDDPKFFLSPDGAADPVSELSATLEAFQAPIVKDKDQQDNEHAICKFPSRYRFIRKHFDSIEFPKPECKSLINYLSRVQTKRVSIVFTSYYMGSASSAFGHSFLRFSGENENELFDTGINFAANPTTSNPILYAIDGLIGVFPATFSAQPYYYKVREYNDFESRDLWSYTLNLTPEERFMLLEHIWELGNIYYNYFYFNENCSYHILRSIEGAIPRIRFYSRRPVYLIPSESIKVLFSKPDLVSKISYRPSIRSTVFSRYTALNTNEQAQLFDALYNQKTPSATPENLAVLDTLIDAIDLNHATELASADVTTTEWKQSVLRTRAQIKLTSASPAIATPSEEAPHLGHGSRRLAIQHQSHLSGSGASREPSRVTAQFRASHHDLLDPSIGYPRHLHIDFGRIGFQVKPDFQLNELNMVDLTALAVNHPIYSKNSYQVRIGYNRSWVIDCSTPLECGVLGLRGGVGRAYSIFRKHTFYFMLNAELGYGFKETGSKLQTPIGPELDAIFEFTPSLKWLLRTEAQYRLFADHPFGTLNQSELRKVWGDEFGLGAKFEFNTREKQTMLLGSIMGYWYF